MCNFFALKKNCKLTFTKYVCNRDKLQFGDLGGSGGAGRVQDVERVVGGDGDAIVGPRDRHLLIPVQRQVPAHRHFLLQGHKRCVRRITFSSKIPGTLTY